MESANRTHALTILIAAARDAADVKNVAAGAKSISDFTTDIDDVGVCIANAASNYIEDYQSTYIVAAQALLASLDAMKVRKLRNCIRGIIGTMSNGPSLATGTYCTAGYCSCANDVTRTLIIGCRHHSQRIGHSFRLNSTKTSRKRANLSRYS